MEAEYHESGNVLLDHLLGAELHTYPDGEDEAGADRSLDDLASVLRDCPLTQLYFRRAD